MPEALRILHTPIGPLRARADESSLLELTFDQGRAPAPCRSKILDLLEQELSGYFSGKRRHFTIPLRLDPSRNTPFQIAAWRALQTIPYGQTLSYRDQAARIGRPGATRAVGSANGANPFPILIPCHRVIRSDGTPGGYAGGLRVKTARLELEHGFSGEVFR